MTELKEKRLFLLDMDGTIYLDEQLFDGTLEFLAHVKRIGGRAMYLTNNSSKSVSSYVDKLKRLGITAEETDFFTSVNATVLHLQSRNFHKIYAFGTASFRQQLLDAGLPVTHRLEEDIECLCMGFAAYIAFYSCDVQALSEEGLVCRRPLGNTYVCRDDRSILEFYYEHRKDSEEELVSSVLKNTGMWGQNLTEIPGLEKEVAQNLKNIRRNGAISAFSSCL